MPVAVVDSGFIEDNQCFAAAQVVSQVEEAVFDADGQEISESLAHFRLTCPNDEAVG